MFIQIIMTAGLLVGTSKVFADPVIPTSRVPDIVGHPDDLEDGTQYVQSSRKKLFAKTGLVIVPTTTIPSDYFLDAVTTVINQGLSDNARKKLTRLQYVMADDSISKRGVEAYYSHDLNALIIGQTSGVKSANPTHHLARTWSVIAHEIGHAYVLSSLSAESLAFLARRFGPWRLNAVDSGAHLFSSQFFRPHPLFGAPAGVINKLENSPSRYALQNVHEWFAECFSSMVKKKLRDQGLIPDLRSSSDMNVRPLSAALQAWFHENVTN